MIRAMGHWPRLGRTVLCSGNGRRVGAGGSRRSSQPASFLGTEMDSLGWLTLASFRGCQPRPGCACSFFRPPNTL